MQYFLWTIPWLINILSETFPTYFKPHISYLKPTNTLRHLLVRLNNPVEKENVVGSVCRIQCEMCDASYIIGETGWRQDLASTAARPPVTLKKPSIYTLSNQTTLYRWITQEFSQLNKMVWGGWWVKEAIYIKAMNPSLNRDGERWANPGPGEE